MYDWQKKEALLLAKENEWYVKLSPFMKLVDNPLTYFGLLLAVSVLAVGLGLLIGLML